MQGNMLKEQGDALDELIAEIPTKVPAHPPPMAHDTYLKRLDTMPRLLTSNVFPGASYGWPKMSYQGGLQARPWQLSREQQRKEFYHRPNEFSELIGASARMGLHLYQKKKE